jgi:hypothetical protein
MSTVTAKPSPVAVTPTRPARVVALLGWREGRRMLTRPVYLFIVGGLFLTVGVSAVQPGATAIGGRADVQQLLGILLTYGALATLFAASLVATSARRTGAEAQFDAAPLDPQLRTLATGLGVLLGPAAVASLLTLALAYVERGIGSPLPVMYSGWGYVQLPLTWLGAGVLGVALARWLPWPGVPLAAFVGLIAWTVWSAGLIYRGRSGGFLMPYVITSRDVLGLGTSSSDGHLGWHAVYLLGLSLLALAAALMRYRPLRERAVLGFGVLAALLTASAAWLQLP